MTREERTKLIKHLKYNRSIGADYLITDNDADEIIKALEQEPSYNSIRTELEPCEDAISRQAAIDAITKTSGIRGDALKALYDLPSVAPQSKMGHWIFNEIYKHYYCSECKSMGVDYWDFCPNCGAKMQEVEE